MAFLKKSEMPYMANGRWYRFFVESDGTDRTLTQSDLTDTTIASGVLKLPAGFHIVDVKCDIHNDTSAAANFTITEKLYADTSLGVTLPSAGSFDYMYIYVFGYAE